MKIKSGYPTWMETEYQALMTESVGFANKKWDYYCYRKDDPQNIGDLMLNTITKLGIYVCPMPRRTTSKNKTINGVHGFTELSGRAFYYDNLIQYNMDVKSSTEFSITLAHELAHMLLPPVYAKNNPTEELQAEAIAFLSHMSLGIDKMETSAGYIGNKSGFRAPKRLPIHFAASKDIVFSTTMTVIKAMEAVLS